MLKEDDHKITTINRLLDLLIITISWALSYAIRFKFMPNAQSGLLDEFIYLLVFLIISSIYTFEKYGLYKSFRLKSLIFEVVQVVKANFTIFTVLIFALYFFKNEKLSRIHLFVYLAISMTLLVVSRIVKSNYLAKLRARGQNTIRIKLMGSGSQIDKFKNLMFKHKECGIKITECESEAEAFVLGYRPDESKELNDFLKRNYNSVKPISILPDLSFSLLGEELTVFDGLPVINLNKPNFPILDLFLKRFIDLLASTVGLLMISPLLFIVSVGVKLSSPGPIFYAQERIGLDGKKFKMWKFRSMKVAKGDEDKTTWSSKNEPRKTKFGSFIRATSIDELPQLWNILIGDMSLVGPRPERSHFVEKFKDEIPNYMLRHKMKAGLTGWAQVNGWRGDTSLIKRIEYDIFYIKHWSIWFDMKIIVLTFVKGFINKNAY